MVISPHATSLHQENAPLPASCSASPQQTQHLRLSAFRNCATRQIPVSSPLPDFHLSSKTSGYRQMVSYHLKLIKMSSTAAVTGLVFFPPCKWGTGNSDEQKLCPNTLSKTAYTIVLLSYLDKSLNILCKNPSQHASLSLFVPI